MECIRVKGDSAFNTDLRAVDRMKTFKRFLESWAQFIEQRCLACPDSVTT